MGPSFSFCTIPVYREMQTEKKPCEMYYLCVILESCCSWKFHMLQNPHNTFSLSNSFSNAKIVDTPKKSHPERNPRKGLNKNLFYSLWSKTLQISRM